MGTRDAQEIPPDPGSAPEAFCQWAEGRLESGFQAEALQGFLRGMDADPGCARAWSGLGVACYRDGLARASRVFFEMAIRLDPADEDSVLNWAESAGRTIDAAQARVFLATSGVDPSLVAKAMEVRGG